MIARLTQLADMCEHIIRKSAAHAAPYTPDLQHAIAGVDVNVCMCGTCLPCHALDLYNLQTYLLGQMFCKPHAEPVVVRGYGMAITILHQTHTRAL